MTKLEKLTKKADPRWDRLAPQDTGNQISWSWADPADLSGAVVSATQDGAAVLLSKTSDGGALVIQIWSGAGRHKLYPASMAELTEALSLISEIGNS